MSNNLDLFVPALAVVIAAALPAILNHRYLRQNLGKKNGQGNAITMIEALLLWSKTHARDDDRRFEALATLIEDSTTAIKTSSTDDADTVTAEARADYLGHNPEV